MKNKLFLIIILFLLSNFLYSESAIDFLNKGKQAYFEEKYDDAIFNIKKSLEINPNYSDALIELAHIYYDLEIYNYAYKYINNALKLSSNVNNLQLFCADIETKLGMYDPAESKYNSILKKDPLNINAQNGLANLYLLNSKFTMAKSYLDNTLKIDPSNFKAFLLTAKYYESISNKKNAEKYYQINIEKNSLNPDSFLYYAIFNFNNNNNKDAISNIKTALKLKDKTLYKKFYGKFLLHDNNGKEALIIFLEILKKDKENYLNYYNLSYAYYLTGDFDNALKSLDIALKLRDDDEISQYFLNNILTEKYDTDNALRKDKANIFYAKSLKAKSESFFDAYLFFLKESIRLYPKIVSSRVELANYFLTENLAERYLRELQLAYKYSNDKNLSERIQMELKRITYRLGDDWNVDQYLVKNDIYNIPLFLIKDINNIHFNIENTFANVFKNIFLKEIKYDLKIYNTKDYSNQEKMSLSRENNSPFYLDLKIIESPTNAEVHLYLINASNNQVIKDFSSIKNGNDKIVRLAYNIQDKLNNTLIFRAHIIKTSKDKALINAGRFSGIKLNDKFVILRNSTYPIEFDRTTFLYSQNDIKGYGYASKVDENITEIKLIENSFVKDIDIDDIIIYKK